MSPKQPRTAVLYARISLSTEKSVSIERQLESGRAYADARGWKVIGEFIDSGVSATHNKPQDRKAWSALLTSPLRFDVVLIWKSDRLARRVTDFLGAAETLEKRGAGLAAVEEALDLTTGQGRFTTTILAAFAEMEASAIRERVTAARAHMLRNGRYVGGRLPYGYMPVPNPDGAGQVIAHDPERLGWLRQIVRRTQDGCTLYSTLQLLRESAPLPIGAASWSYSVLDRLVRHPLLAGMTLDNPGRTAPGQSRGSEVLRDRDGLPIVNEALAVLPLGQWRALQARLATTPEGGHKQPRAMHRVTSGLLSGLVFCAEHDEPVRMYRGTAGAQNLPAYQCPECYHTMTNVDALVVPRFLERMGDQIRLRAVQEVVEGGAVQHQEASLRLAQLVAEIVNASPDRAAEIVAEIPRLKAIQEEAKDQPAEVRYVPADGPERTYADDWADATDDEQRRAMIGQALDRVLIRRGRKGQWTEAARLARMTFEWMPAGDLG
jgi:site-specific DNA recombinase